MKLLADSEIPSFSETRLLMGTVINLTVVSDDGTHLAETVEQTFTEIERLIGVFDHRSPTNEVARLNQSGSLVSPSTELSSVIDHALVVSALTDGSFDITIKPVLDAFRNGTVVSEKLTSLVGYQYLLSAEDEISFSRPGVEITLDGIAKGAVIDAGVAILKKFGFENVMFEAGGDLMAAGQRGSSDPWHIGVKHPRAADFELISVINLRNQAAATSGDYQYKFSSDMSEHHIISPIDFKSPEELASVSVIAPTAMKADALSTAIMVMGSAKGIAMVNQLPGIEAFLVTKNLDIITSVGFTADI